MVDQSNSGFGFESSQLYTASSLRSQRSAYGRSRTNLVLGLRGNGNRCASSTAPANLTGSLSLTRRGPLSRLTMTGSYFLRASVLGKSWFAGIVERVLSHQSPSTFLHRNAQCAVRGTLRMSVVPGLSDRHSASVPAVRHCEFPAVASDVIEAIDCQRSGESFTFCD